MYRNYQLGLGAGQEPIAQPVIGTTLSAGVPIAAASGLIPGISSSALVVPIIGAAIAGVTLLVGLFLNRQGPKQKVATTQAVNEAEGLMKQNLAAWENSDKNSAEQQQAEANYWGLWNQIVQFCSQDQMGAPGRACIEDRLGNGRTLNAPNGKQYVGNGKYDYQQYYLDPIASFTPTDAGLFGSNSSSSNGIGLLPIIGLLVIGGFALASSSK